MNEKLIESKLRKGVKSMGGLAAKLICPFITGWPDRTVLMPGGKLWFVELKTTGKKPDERQKIVRKEIMSFGFNYRVVDSEAALKEFLKELSYAV
jgi:hypothetical protein